MTAIAKPSQEQIDAWLADLRAQAADPGTLFIVIPRRVGGSIAISPKDIVGKSDDELLAYVAARLAET